jgi:hypothetical protein
MSVVLCLAAAAASAATGLELKPCTIELVDGREVEGHLAVQFDMPEHLIVYAPRLATMRSFFKKHVHALTVDGTRREMNPKRALTEEEKQILGRVTWPNEPPADGRKAPYTTETWETPRQLLVWARPGTSGQFEKPTNWLVNGRPMQQWPEAIGDHYGLIFFSEDGTDFLFPASTKPYRVRPRTNARARHITVQDGADAEISLNACNGNIWVTPRGDFHGGGNAPLSGSKHTFIVNGEPYEGEGPNNPEQFAKLMKGGKGLANKWVVRKDDPAASVELIGSFGSGDETHWMRGVTVLSENSTISIGGRCTQTIGRDATLIMRSGSVLGKNGNQLYKDDVRLKGALLVGTPEEPITRNVYFGVSIKDPEGTYPKSDRAPRWSGFRLKSTGASAHGQGLMIAPGGSLAVHTTDREKARLIITWHGITDMGSDDGTQPGYFDELPRSERTINLVFLDDVELSDVVLDWLGEGDIRMVDPDVRRNWRRVSFGDHNQASGDALYARFPLTDDDEKKLARYRREASENKTESGRWAYDKTGRAYPRILPSGGIFAAGDTVEVRLHALGDRQMRYTIDGGDSEKGTLYRGPFRLSRTATVEAGCFHNPPPHFYRQWGRVRDTFTFVDEVREADAPGRTRPGVMLRIYNDDPIQRESGTLGRPEATTTLQSIEPYEGEHEDAGGLVYSGYVQVERPGIYRFYTETDGRSRLYLGDRRVVDNHRRYQGQYSAGHRGYLRPPLESWGSLKLEPGKHRFHLVCSRRRGRGTQLDRFAVQWEGPGIAKGPIPAHALSH